MRERYRDRYFKGYVIEKSPGKKPGKYRKVYVYHGDYYYWCATQVEIAALKIRYLILLLADTAMFLVVMGWNSRATQSAWPMLAGLLSLIPLFSEIIAVVQFMCTEDKVREFEFEELNTRVRWSTLLRGIALLMGCLLSVIWAFLTHVWKGFLLLAFAYFFCAGCSLAIYCKHRTLGARLVEEGDYGDIVDETYTEKNMPVRKVKEKRPGKKKK